MPTRVRLRLYVSSQNGVLYRDDSRFLSDRKLSSPPKVFVGAAANPYAPPLDYRPYRLKKKIEAGAQFVQTSTVLMYPGSASICRRFAIRAS
ncbi:MAG: hypothetical protein Ct9H300mP16_16530 [Pseudomonadota bacterium]|nr:MAG: hypothetical protein Ct9H300mP16_16530 [Pseudomonadota bacterium]